MRGLFQFAESEPLSPCFSSLSTETVEPTESSRDANCANAAISAASSGTLLSVASTGSNATIDWEPRESSVFASCRVQSPGATTILFPRFYSFIQVIVFGGFHVVCDEATTVTARRNRIFALCDAVAAADRSPRFATVAPAEAASRGDDAASGGGFGGDVDDGVGFVARADGAFAPFLPTVAAAGGKCAVCGDAVWGLGGSLEEEGEGVCDGRRSEEVVD